MTATQELERILLLGSDENVATRVKALRTARGWSLAQLAERLAAPDIGYVIDRSSVFKIESGDTKRRVSLREALAFAKAFDVSVDVLYLTDSQVAERELGAAVSKAIDELDAAHRAWSAYADAVDAARALLARVGDRTAAEAELDEVRASLKTTHLKRIVHYWLKYQAQRIERGEKVDEELMSRGKEEIAASEDFARFCRAIGDQPTHVAIDDIRRDAPLGRDALLPDGARALETS